MIIVFMVLAPVAAIVARYYKPILPDSWFRVHMGVMVGSVLGILVGFGLILGHTAGTFTTVCVCVCVCVCAVCVCMCAVCVCVYMCVCEVTDAPAY